MHSPYLYIRDRALRPGDNVLVVGGTGLLGRALAAVLGASRLRVVSVSRNRPAGGALPAGCVHVPLAANDVPAWLGSPAALELLPSLSPLAVVDVLSDSGRATAALLNALDGRLGRFVGISSASVLGAGEPGRAYSESDPPVPTSPPMEAKLEVERTVRSAAEQRGVAASCLRLAYPYGPGHGPLTPLGRDRQLFASLRRNDPIDWIAPGVLPPLQPVWSGDVAWAVHALLTRRARPRPLYHLAGPRTGAWADYRAARRAALGSRSPVRHHGVAALLEGAGARGHWLRHYLPDAPLLDDRRLRNEVYACRTELGDTVAHWANWALSGLG